MKISASEGYKEGCCRNVSNGVGRDKNWWKEKEIKRRSEVIEATGQ